MQDLSSAASSWTLRVIFCINANRDSHWDTTATGPRPKSEQSSLSCRLSAPTSVLSEGELWTSLLMIFCNSVMT